jgi:hypothetical protein
MLLLQSRHSRIALPRFMGVYCSREQCRCQDFRFVFKYEKVDSLLYIFTDAPSVVTHVENLHLIFATFKFFIAVAIVQLEVEHMIAFAGDRKTHKPMCHHMSQLFEFV